MKIAMDYTIMRTEMLSVRIIGICLYVIHGTRNLGLETFVEPRKMGFRLARNQAEFFL